MGLDSGGEVASQGKPSFIGYSVCVRSGGWHSVVGVLSSRGFSTRWGCLAPASLRVEESGILAHLEPFGLGSIAGGEGWVLGN